MYEFANKLGCPPNYGYGPDPNQIFPIDINKVACVPTQYISMNHGEPILTSLVKTINIENPQKYLDNVKTIYSGEK